MGKENISVLYKTLMGKPAMRWAQENEYPRFEREIPVVSDGFRNLFLEPNNDWQPEDESMINQMLGQQFQNPPYVSINNFLSRRNKEKTPQQPYVRNLLSHPDKDKGEIIREPFYQEKPGNLFRQLSESAQKAKSQEVAPKWKLLEGLQPQVQSNPQKSNPQQPLSEDQLDLINYGLRYRTNLPGQEWFPEELKGNSASNYGYAPYNLPMGGNTQREEEIKEEDSSLENREGMPYFERGNIEPQEKIIERWLSNHRSEADKRRLLSSPSPFRGRNQIHWEMLPPSEYGIENLYDKENSDLSPELFNEFNAIVKELRADPKINHLITEIEKGGKIAFIMDEEAKNPYYDPNRKCIGIPADYMNSSDKKTPLLEELIHRGQHLIYGDKMGEINPRTIEAEAKMFQDFTIQKIIHLV